MKISMSHTGKTFFTAVMLLAALLFIAGCAEIKPYSPPNHREEGPAKGLFTGSQGAWVITLPEAIQAGGEEEKNTAADSENVRKEKKNPEKSADDAQK